MIGAIIQGALKAIELIIPDPQERARMQLEVLKLESAGEFKELEEQTKVVVAEAHSEHPLTSQWRPITMLCFVGFIGAHWFGYTAENLDPAQVGQLLDIVKIGLGGYVVGRSAEKTARAWKSTK